MDGNDVHVNLHGPTEGHQTGQSDFHPISADMVATRESAVRTSTSKTQSDMEHTRTCTLCEFIVCARLYSIIHHGF